jgi:hypothetical protein
MEEDCLVKKKNLGLYKCYKLPQLIKGMIWTPDDWRMPKADEGTLAAWQAAIFDPIDRIYYFPPFVKMEPANTEAVYEDTPFAMLPVLDGQYRFRAHIRQNMCTHRNLYTHRGSGGRIILVDNLNQLLGTRDDNGDFMGVKLALLNTEKLALNTGTTATTSPIFVALEDAMEIDQYGEIISAKFLKSIIRINDVNIIQVSAAAASIVVDVKVDCDGTPVLGLVAADFQVFDPDGTVHAITSVTPHPTVLGRYTIAGVGFIDASSVTLRDASQLTLDGYEAAEPLVVDFA